MIRNLKVINAYPEFRTTAGINQVKNAVIAGNPPAGLTPAQTARFNRKFLGGEWVVVGVLGFLRAIPGHGVQRLKYRPSPDIDLLVAYPDEREIYLNRIWGNSQRGYGLGLQSFYLQVALSHLNIQKRYTDAFLKSKGNYQIQKTPVVKIISPIKANASNERWGMDLIDMSVGVIHRYILTVVDYFSGYLFTRRLTNRTATTIVNNLQDIINTPLPFGSGGTAPHLLQSDNGAEFRNAVMGAFTTTNGISHIFSTSYHPRSNGKVERKNRDIRKKIKAGFIRQNSNTWDAIMLRDYTININSQPNLKSKLRAIDLYRTGYTPPVGALGPEPDLDNNNTHAQLSVINRHYQNNRAIRLTHGALPTFNVGDLVRVHLFALSVPYRRAIKEHQGTNKFVVHWSPVVSRIVQVLPPNQTTRMREMYVLTVGPTTGYPPPVGQVAPLMRGAVPWEFAGNEITLAGDRVSIAPRTIPRAEQMNRRN